MVAVPQYKVGDFVRIATDFEGMPGTVDRRGVGKILKLTYPFGTHEHARPFYQIEGRIWVVYETLVAPVKRGFDV